RTAGVANRVIGDSRITNGVIYVGTDIVNFDITLQSQPVIVPVTRPNPPTNLTATPSQTSITLAWTPVPGAATYTLYRADSPSGPFVAIGTGIGTTTYVDTAVAAGRTYYYYVTAVNAGGESGASTVANATVPQPPTPPVTPPTPPTPPVTPPTPPTQPEPPADLKVTPGDKQVDLTWTPSAGATCYIVYRATAPGGPYTAIATCVTGTAYTDTAVQPGVTYYYIVSAVGPAGEGKTTPEKQASLKAPMEPRPTVETHTRYIMGYPDGTFRPERSISRAEVATILARISGAKVDVSLAGPAKYPDVATTHWATRYISATTTLGLMKGDPDGKFRPEDPISRAEVATIAVRFKHLFPTEGIAFADTAGHWGVGYVKAAADAGLMNGYPDGTFRPSNAISRAEFVTVINRLLSRGPLFDRPSGRWPDVTADHWAFGHVQEASIGHDYLPHATLSGEAWVNDHE
ncbi:MAG TPA: S-layer homology domain-containing protein, partial [Symbiobacteriaceae bacterium]|nr:S-layer homology domain-containing protein [Symbiobacteriaceae bacterium]